jgi:hypothetical protein
VSDETDEVIEFFPTRGQAERMLARVLSDEPDWRGILRVERVELRRGTANQPAAARPQASLENGLGLAAEQPCLGRGGEAVLRRSLV